MKIAGIVCEFNPFHYGHKYLIDKIKNDWDNFWDNITSSFGDFTKVLMIALGVVGGLFVTVLLIKFISVLFSGKRGRRK